MAGGGAHAKAHHLTRSSISSKALAMRIAARQALIDQHNCFILATKLQEGLLNAAVPMCGWSCIHQPGQCGYSMQLS